MNNSVTKTQPGTFVLINVNNQDLVVCVRQILPRSGGRLDLEYEVHLPRERRSREGQWLRGITDHQIRRLCTDLHRSYWPLTAAHQVAATITDSLDQNGDGWTAEEWAVILRYLDDIALAVRSIKSTV